MPKNTLPLLSATLFIWMFANCSKKANPVNVINIINEPKIFYCWLKVSTQNGILYSDPIPDSSGVSVAMSWGNHNQKLLSHISEGRVYFYSDSVHYFGDTTITIKIVVDSDTGMGCVQVPSGTSILTPSDNDTLPVDSIKCIWTTAERADWYRVTSYYNAIDTLGNYYSSTKYIDTFLLDTAFVIPLSYYYDPIARYYQFQVMVEPYSGPMFSPSTMGNIVGDIKGFLYGIGNPGFSSFCVGVPLKNAKHKRFQ